MPNVDKKRETRGRKPLPVDEMGVSKTVRLTIGTLKKLEVMAAKQGKSAYRLGGELIASAIESQEEA